MNDNQSKIYWQQFQELNNDKMTSFFLRDQQRNKMVNLFSLTEA